jgi:hypothetical protein
MAATQKSARASKRAPKKPTVADLLARRMERERRLNAKAPPAALNEKLFPITTAAPRLGISVWLLRHMASDGRLNYRRIGRRIFISESEIARLAGSELKAVNAA